MNDLAAFLNARLDEREQTLRKAGEGRIAWLSYYRDDGHINYTTVAAGDGEADAPDDVWVADGKDLPAPKRVLVVHDQARELAEVEAKRRIIDEHQITDQGCETCGNYDPTGLHDHHTDGPCATLRLLALPHADHPDYLEKWKP